MIPPWHPILLSCSKWFPLAAGDIGRQGPVSILQSLDLRDNQFYGQLPANWTANATGSPGAPTTLRLDGNNISMLFDGIEPLTSCKAATFLAPHLHSA